MSETGNNSQSSWPIRVGVVVAAVIFLAIIGPVLAAAAIGGAWLMALGGLAVTGVAIGKALPWLGQKWENKILSLRKSEARKNPIEQLQNFFMEKRQKVNDFKTAVGQIGGQIASLAALIEQRKREKANADVSKQEASIKAMKAAYDTLKQKYVNAEKALKDLEGVIEDRKFEWKFAQAGQMAISAINATSGEDLVNQMLADEAHSAVLDNFNAVFADLDMEAAKLSSESSMDFGNGMALDVSSINLLSHQPANTVELSAQKVSDRVLA